MDKLLIDLILQNLALRFNYNKYCRENIVQYKRFLKVALIILFLKGYLFLLQLLINYIFN